MQEKSINLASSTNHNSYIHPLHSNHQSIPYNTTFHPGALPNSRQVPQNYVQVSRGNLAASVNQPMMANSRALPLSSYPIIFKGIVQSQHNPPSSLIRQLPVVRRHHPQYDLNPNFDYQQANFLCQAKIAEEVVYCPVCNSKYLGSQKEKHLQKHIRKPSSNINEDLSIKIKDYLARQHKVGHKIRPIVQPQECYADFKPNTYKIIQKIIYEDSAPNIKQQSIGFQQKQPEYVHKSQDAYFQLEPEPNILSNYHNSIQQHHYTIDGHQVADQPIVYGQPPKLNQPLIYAVNNQELKLPIPATQSIQIEPSQMQISKRLLSYDNNNLQRRTMTPKASAVQPVGQARHSSVIEESLSNRPQQQQNINVQPQNYNNQSFNNNGQRSSMKRSLAQIVNNDPRASQNERFRATLNQNQKDNAFQNQQPLRPLSQAESFSNPHQIQSSRNEQSNKGSQAYFNQLMGNNRVQGEEMKPPKQGPFRSQW